MDERFAIWASAPGGRAPYAVPAAKPAVLLLSPELTMPPALLETSALLVVVGVLGALPLYTTRWSGRGLHALVSVAAGIFLGTLFLHLLPELSRSQDGVSLRAPWLAALLGLLALFIVEKVWLEGRAGTGDPHAVVWFATFLGLAAHAFAAGLGLAAMGAQPELLWPLALPLSVHKAGESFSLATVLRLGQVASRRAVIFLAAFLLATPLGIWLGWTLTTFTDRQPHVTPLLTGLAAGTFLYVAVCNLLPEVFHGPGRGFGRVAGLLAGLALAAAGTWGL